MRKQESNPQWLNTFKTGVITFQIKKSGKIFFTGEKWSHYLKYLTVSLVGINRNRKTKNEIILTVYSVIMPHPGQNISVSLKLAEYEL